MFLLPYPCLYWPVRRAVGLSQRALALAVLGWVAMLGIYIAKQSKGAP
jgi:hypothetical protein